MLRAVRNTARKTEIESALTAYERLADAFNFRPELEGILVDSAIMEMPAV
jgi:hypothetical protein